MIDHQHLIIRAEVEKPFTDPEIAKDWLQRLVNAIGMTITKSGGPYADYVDKPGNCGIAAFAMIETSHCALHIWDQVSPPLVQMDVYSCRAFDVDTVLNFLNEMTVMNEKHVIIDRRIGLKFTNAQNKV